MQIDDARLSRNHACFTVAGDELSAKVEDLRSSNGVLVNGERIDRPTMLRDGDVVVCGPVVLVVNTGDDIDDGLIQDPEPPRPDTYRRKTTEEMPPAALSGVATPQVRQHRNAGTGRHLDPAITAAIASRTATSEVLRPSPAPQEASGALSDQTPPPTPALEPAPRQSAVYRSAQGQTGDDPDLALEPAANIVPSQRRFAWKRVLAGLVDGGGVAVLACLLGSAALIAGWIAALARTGVVLDRAGLPVLAPGQTAPIPELLRSLFLPGGPERAWDLVAALRQAQDHVPFLCAFLGATGAVAALALAILLGLVAPTVSAGAPPCHRALRLRIVKRRNGHHPGWLRAGTRWLLLLLLWPFALVWIGLGRSGPHDLIAGTEIRPR